MLIGQDREHFLGIVVRSHPDQFISDHAEQKKNCQSMNAFQRLQCRQIKENGS